MQRTAAKSPARLWAVAAMATAVIGFTVGAAPTARPTLASRPFIQDVAKHLGVSPGRLQQAIIAAQIDRIQAAQKAGRLTSAQADRLIARAKSGQAWLGLCPHWRHHRAAQPSAMAVGGTAAAPVYDLVQAGDHAIGEAGQWMRREARSLARGMDRQWTRLKDLGRPLP